MPSLVIVPPAYRGVPNKGDVMKLADFLLQSVDILYKLVVIGVGLGIPVILKCAAKPMHTLRQKMEVLSQMAEQFDPANNNGKTLKDTILEIKNDTEELVKQREERINYVEEQLKSIAKDRRERVVIVDERFDKQDKQIARIEKLMHLQNETFGIKEPSQLKEPA